ncbi:MAG: sulfatase-like hydrolase/transferase [Oscillospiraceae bacterium]|nr:sulfatase-like hydrolase/transferase [Oscillospiraceae bacterium]
MIKKLWGKIRKAPSLSPRTSTVLTVSGLLLGSMCLTMLILLVGTVKISLGRVLYYFNAPLMVLLNYLPVAVLMLVLYLLLNRAWLAFLLTSVVGYVIAFVNYFKVLFRAEPFVVADFSIMLDGVEAGGEFTYVLPPIFWIGLLAIGLGTFLLGRYARSRIPRKVWWTRIVGVLLCLGFAQFMWSPYYADWDYYKAFLEEDYSVYDDWILWQRFSKRGIIYSFVHSISETVTVEPNNYDPKMVEEILSHYETELIPENKQINVQIHMLESFADLSEMGISFQKDPYEAWHKLQQESYCGRLLADTHGGGTNNAERSVLTGFTYVHPLYHTLTNSHVWFFRESGYETQSTHPGDDWFYDRYAINRRLGFWSSLFDQNYFKDFPGVYHGKDEDYFPLVRDLYEENVASGKPYFGFHVTYQNHSPYEYGTLLGEEFVSHEGISDQAYYGINNYLSGINETGEQIAQYVDLYRQDSEPALLVFFGDHKATLGDSDSVYEELGVDINEGGEESYYNIYATPYLIWANDAAQELLQKEVRGTGPVISPGYLMNEIFDICEWKGSAWLQYQNDICDVLPVIHRRSTYLVDGALTQELPKEIDELRLQRNRVEYYWRYNFTENP